MHLQIKQADIGYHQPLISNAEAGLKSGEVCLLIGNNGVGKTTLIRSLLHQVPLLNGEILLGGRSVKQFSAREIAEHIAVVYSKPVLPQHHTVEDLIALGKYIYYPYYFELTRKDREEISHTIDMLGMDRYRHTSLKNLSDGNLQKAFIGRAITQNSPVIILDEPTTHLDEKNKINILQTLRRLAHEQNKIILFSSHDWRLAKEFADKIWYIKEGRLYSGMVEDVLIQHGELTRASIFRISEHFKAPVIEAPHIHKEMLFSLLQKNFPQDLSGYHFTHKRTHWVIRNNETRKECESFEEIFNFMKNIH
ncbi:ABC transporter ATP-binding protein [uncultured Chryseobacterium sp.]|uniref:ABC transporter ATP-binding protein n=1 Tax=uncultured Chryseobacterium sp. TaxID=259322 RepID=UPI0025F62E00|nr:ABC transporter ATP-binding protein [uncultured Chryseobacterium sp.]